jgi:hypothetical protein
MNSTRTESDSGPEDKGPSPLRRFVVGPIGMAAYGLMMAAIPLLSCGANDTQENTCDALCGSGSWQPWVLLPAGAAFVAGLFATTHKQYRSFVALGALTGLLPWLVLATC